MARLFCTQKLPIKGLKILTCTWQCCRRVMIHWTYPAQDLLWEKNNFLSLLSKFLGDTPAGLCPPAEAIEGNQLFNVQKTDGSYTDIQWNIHLVTTDLFKKMCLHSRVLVLAFSDIMGFEYLKCNCHWKKFGRLIHCRRSDVSQIMAYSSCGLWIWSYKLHRVFYQWILI